MQLLPSRRNAALSRRRIAAPRGGVESSRRPWKAAILAAKSCRLLPDFGLGLGLADVGPGARREPARALRARPSIVAAAVLTAPRSGWLRLHLAAQDASSVLPTCSMPSWRSCMTALALAGAERRGRRDHCLAERPVLSPAPGGRTRRALAMAAIEMTVLTHGLTPWSSAGRHPAVVDHLDDARRSPCSRRRGRRSAGTAPRPRRPSACRRRLPCAASIASLRSLSISAAANPPS